jgi:hypothetical protein
MRQQLGRWTLALCLIGSTLGLGVLSAHAADPQPAPLPEPLPSITFEMVRSPGAEKANCLPYAKGEVTITSEGPVEVMDVTLSGLPAKTEFDFFVIQLPNAPFGLSWYQGDIETDDYGNAYGQFIGRFNIETFIIAPGVGPAPVVHKDDPFPDAAENPQVGPVHTFHLGLWFNAAKDAANAGCPDIVTPFNGEHNAGVQILNTANFPDAAGPLSQLVP